MEPLPSLAEIEQYPDFIESPPERKVEIYDNYFKRRESEAKTEDDFNRLLQEKADRNRNSVKMQIAVNHPFLDNPDFLPKPLQDQITKTHEMDSEFKYNQEATPEKYQAPDMEDPNRSLQVKPFKYNGQSGFSIKYPNGEIESVPGIETKAQLTEFLKTKADKFDGKREGWFDNINPLAETELDGVINSINQVSSGIEGATNAAAKTIKSIAQGFDLKEIDQIKQDANRYSEAQSTIAQLEPLIAREERQIKEFDRGDKMKLSEMKQEKATAEKFLADNPDTSYEKVQPQLTEKYSNLIASIQESNKIGGSKVLDDFNKHIQSLPEAERGDASAFGAYFKQNPLELLPYIATTAAAASPDIAMGLGSSLVAGAMTGPAGAMAAGEAVGYQREYTATLLSEMQLRAAKQNKELTPEVLNSYLDNPEFMDQVRTKAKTRGAVIGAADAVLGGAAEKIVESSIKGTVKKALAGGAVGAITEGAGEGLAQVASGEKKNFTEIFNEAIGGLGATAVTAPAVIVDNSIKGRKAVKTAEFQQKVQDRVNAGIFFGQLKESTSSADRINQMKESLPEIPRVIDKTAFEGEQAPAFEGDIQQGLDGKQGFPKAEQKPFAAQEQKPLSGQVQKPFTGEVVPALTEDAPVVEPAPAPTLTEEAPVAPKTNSANSGSITSLEDDISFAATPLSDLNKGVSDPAILQENSALRAAAAKRILASLNKGDVVLDEEGNEYTVTGTHKNKVFFKEVEDPLGYEIFLASTGRDSNGNTVNIAPWSIKKNDKASTETSQDSSTAPAPVKEEAQLTEDNLKKQGYIGPIEHATNSDPFTEFDPSRIGSQTDGGYFGVGFYFGPPTKLDSIYGKNKIKAYVKLKKPYIWTRRWNGLEWEQNTPPGNTSEERTKWMKNHGHDGVITQDIDGNLMEVVVFSENYKNIQIISGFNNNKTQLTEETAGVEHAPNEVAPETKALDAVAETTEEKEVVADQAKQDIAQKRYDNLKAAYPEVLKDHIYNGTNLQEARELVTDHLESHFDDIDGEGKEITARKKEEAAKLQINLHLAVNALPEKIQETNMTDSQVGHILDAMEYIIGETKDMANMSTARLKYYNNVLGSFADGGALVGLKNVVSKVFIKKWMGALNTAISEGAIFDKPIAPIRNGPFFNLFSGSVGTMASLANEVSHMGRNEAAHSFARDLLGVFKDNIDYKQLEERAVTEAWYQHLNSVLPKISNESDRMIGIAARLTQWDRNSPVPPLTQIVNRNSQLTDSFSDAQPVVNKAKGAMLAHDPKEAAIVKQAYDKLIGNTDLASFPDEQAAVQFIESRLSKQQLSVLNKTRDMGRAFLPFLQNVKAVTKNAVLQDFANYVHDSNITPNEGNESHNVKESDSMSDVLHDRKGIDAANSYPQTSIRGIAEHQSKASTYEKHTGMERYLFRQLLSDKTFTNALNSYDNSRGISDRLLKLAEVYNESMTKNQPKGNAFWALAQSAASLIAGRLIFGINNTVHNFISSAVARASLVGLSRDAMRNAFVYEQNMPVINKFLKTHVPTQFNRTSHYDVIEGSDARFGVRNEFKLQKELGKGFVTAAISSAPYLPQSAINKIQKHVFSRLGNISNALPERQNAFAIWTAAYIHYAQQNGTILDAQDFINRMVHDKRAANDANDFVTKVLGYAPDKASKGSFWNGSTRAKQVTSMVLYTFMQQSTGLAVTAQNELLKANRLFRSGDYKEGMKAATIAGVALSNVILFRWFSTALKTAALYPVLSQYFNGSDEEKKKKALLETRRKYEETSARSNQGQMYKDVASAVFPFYAAAPLVTGVFNTSMDIGRMVATPDSKKPWYDLGIEFKKNIEEQSKVIDGQLKQIDNAIKTAEKMGQADSPQVEQLHNQEEKLTTIKNQLTEKLKFSYLTGDKLKAATDPMGTFGIASEYIIKQIKNFTDDDLTTDEKKELDRLLREEFTYVDPMGQGLLNGVVSNPIKLLGALYDGELGKDKKDVVPTMIQLLKLLKAGQNPEVILERARQAMATEAAKENIKARKRAIEIQQKLGAK